MQTSGSVDVDRVVILSWSQLNDSERALNEKKIARKSSLQGIQGNVSKRFVVAKPTAGA